MGVLAAEQGDIIGSSRLAGHQRLFGLRTFDVNDRLLAECGQVEHASTWDLGPDEWQYRVLQLRVGG